MTESPPRPPRTAWQRFSRWVPYLLAALAIYLLWAPRASGPEAGTEAAAFDLPVILNGEGRLRLEQVRGEPVLVEVFASWCATCQRSAPIVHRVAAAQREHPARFVAISVDDDPEAGRQAAREWGISFPVAHDTGSFARAYRIAVLPTFILIDADGKVREVAAGGVSERRLESWLSSLGSERVQ